jgi:sialate O-acetylesterase
MASQLKKFLLGLLLFASLASIVCSEPRLPHLFSDHMVLQRGAEIRVWGWAAPGESITVSLAGKSQQTTAANDSRWSVSLPALPAGGPFLLEVRGSKAIVIKDVMIGEVWVASGQSNMTYDLAAAATGAQEIPKANDSGLRFFTVPKRIAVEPLDDTLPAAWEIATSETSKKFSAVGYFFARDLRRDLGVPVGVILSAWPGSSAEEWTDPASLRREPLLQPIASRWEASPPGQKAYAAKPREFSLEFDDFELLPAKSDAPAMPFSDFNDGSSHTSTGSDWSFSWYDAPDSVFSLVAPGRGGTGYAARIAGSLDGTSYAQLQAQLHADTSPMNLSDYAGIRFSVRGNGAFSFRTLQPSISDWDDYSSNTFHATPDWQQVTIWFKDLSQEGWGVQKEFTLNQLTAFALVCMTDLEYPPRPPSGMYEGMIAPLESYGIRGAIWYQGESNTDRAFQYRTLLPAMIRGWRDAWKLGDFPFLIVQLPNHGSSPEFGDSIWAELREAQLLTAGGVKNAGLAVTIDVGDPHNVHPARKEEVGQRLALVALGTTYGKKVVYSGPIYESMQVEGKEIRILFQHPTSKLQIHGESLHGFTIAGADHKFHLAAARIDGDTIVVTSPEVESPVAVRYAWANSPDCNLYNEAGLPASPFRTDDWPGASFTKR